MVVAFKAARGSAAGALWRLFCMAALMVIPTPVACESLDSKLATVLSGSCWTTDPSTCPDTVINLNNSPAGNPKLTGTIPTEIGELMELTYIQISYNDFAGPIPTEFGQLIKLEKLFLNNNEFLSGSLPTELGTLALLDDVAIETTDIIGPIPSELGNLNMLIKLKLHQNPKLDGTVPTELGRLTRIWALYLDRDPKLSGSIPTEFGQLTYVHHLKMGTTNLCGVVPSKICLTTGGISLADVCDFSGVTNICCETGSDRCGLPSSCSGYAGCPVSGMCSGNEAAATDLATLNGSTYGIDCGAHMQLKADHANLVGNGIDLSAKRAQCCEHPPGSLVARLEEVLPASGQDYSACWEAKNCTGDLCLESNDLTGTVPADIGKLGQLTHLLLQENELEGSLSAEIGDLAQLIWLVCESNGLTGSIPLDFGKLAELGVLSLQYNRLTGEIPPELGNLTKLYTLSLHGNMFCGTIPVELGDISELSILTLQGNNLNGPLPSELGANTKLTHLELNSNKLDGTLPEHLSNITGLRVVALHDNNFCGNVPSRWCSNPPSDKCEIALFNNLACTYCDVCDMNATACATALCPAACDASAAPADGSVGDCTDHVFSGETCQPECNPGFQISGPTLCFNGSLTAATCNDNPTLQALVGVPCFDAQSCSSIFLDHRGITGSVPADLAKQSDLQQLVLDSNRVEGTLPAELGNLDKLSYLCVYSL